MAEESGPTHMTSAPPEHARPDGAPASLAEFVEEKKSPDNSEQAVRIPEREAKLKPNIANGKDGQSVGYGPQAAGRTANDQMRRAADVCTNLTIGRGSAQVSSIAPEKRR